MDAENLALDDSADSKVIEDFGAVLPWVGISVLSNGLIVESIDGSDLASLVVSSKESDVRWVLHLEAEKQLESFNRVEASIYEITHEDVSRVWDFTALVEQFQQVVELSMDVTTDSHWCFDWLNIAFLDKDLLHFFAKDAELALWQYGALLDCFKPVVDIAATHFFRSFIFDLKIDVQSIYNLNLRYL